LPAIRPTPPQPEHPSLDALLQAVCRRWPRRVALHCLGRDVRYAQLDAWSRALAAWLQAAGVRPGDRVAVMLPNLPQLPLAAAAVWRAGAVLVNVPPQLGSAELEYLLRDSGARVLFALDEALPVLQPLAGLLGPSGRLPLRRVVLATPGDLLGPLRGRWVNRRRPALPASGATLPGALDFMQALADGRRQVLAPSASGPDDMALLQYTGGTTGRPLGAVLLHRQMLANLRQCAAAFAPALADLPPDEPLVTACVLPLHHLYGFGIALLQTLMHGGTCVLLPAPLDAAHVLKTLARQRVHCLPGTDPVFDALARHPLAQTLDWSTLRLAVAGSAPLRCVTALRWAQCTGRPLHEGYGLTEASPAVSCTPVDGPGWDGSIGQPLPDTEWRLVDEAGERVPPGVPGEILVRGPQLMAGYWQRPEETARVMTADGFFRTGDIGVLDEHGALRLVDRKKDTILVSGFNVYPSEVEGVVTQLPGVAECAAVALRDARVGEAVKLIVVKADPASASPSEAEVRAHCETHLSGYKRPRVVEFRPALPKTPIGKVMRRALREHG
jgi:long-chain acyl-CoA synthetase